MMQQSGSQQNQQSVSRPTGRRNFRRSRSYTLKQAIVPKTCGLLPGSAKPEELSVSGVRTGRAIYIFCGMLFVGAGLYSVLF